MNLTAFRIQMLVLTKPFSTMLQSYLLLCNVTQAPQSNLFDKLKANGTFISHCRKTPD